MYTYTYCILLIKMQFIFTATLTIVMAIKCDYPKSTPIFALQLNMPTLNEGTTVLNSTNNNSIRVCVVIRYILYFNYYVNICYIILNIGIREGN